MTERNFANIAGEKRVRIFRLPSPRASAQPITAPAEREAGRMLKNVKSTELNR